MNIKCCPFLIHRVQGKQKLCLLDHCMHNLNNKVRDRPVEMNKNPVPQVNTFKCLGVDLDGKTELEELY